MPELLDLARRIASAARDGEEIEAFVSRSRTTHVRAYQGEVEELSSAESAGVGVRVIAGGRQGFACVGSLDESSAEKALAEARDNATFASVDEHAGLAVPDGVADPDIDPWSDEVASFAADKKIALALDLERMTRGRDARIRQVPEANYGDSAGESVIATSTGIESSSRRTGCHLSVEAIAGDSRSDEQYTAVGYSVGRGPGDLDPEEAAADGTTRALRLLGATKPASAHVTVVLDRRVASTLLSIIGGTLSGEDVMKGRSLFGGRLGEDVAVAGFTLFEDATDPHAYGASRFDAEGLACRRVPLIEAGRLTGYLYNTYGARMAGVASTASAVRGGYRTTPGTGARALAIEPGELDFDRILKQVGDGLYVQSISGVHSGVNPISGDFSVGAVGLFVKDGELAAPVREVTIASTIQRMMQRIVAVGSDLEWPPGSACGVSLAIGDIAMSGA